MKSINLNYTKILIINIISYLYLNIYFRLINFELLDDLERNIKAFNLYKKKLEMITLIFKTMYILNYYP